ncbi:LANO_0H13322g1_1 [Lachancea nothofagi CBS 11611]|uniref:LANO_0H13322g1_1 n=1 Tax=Lachancea nothofagi CBS 11611 TaxID=1266666 RepID=A0A1G4KMB0_9SACH|nr:LANO_0H13322g1_1 [Lachancea nothofagi CBS 11611]
MSYYNRFKNQRNNTPQTDSGGTVDEPDAIFELGKNKRVTVRQFRNMNLIDIREYYADAASGEMKPGKKGISLTEEVYDELLKHRQNIDDALRRFGSKRPRTKTVNVLSDNEDSNMDMEATMKRSSNIPDSKPSRAEKPRKERKKKAPAPPQAQPDEKRRRIDELEAKAQLVIPGGARVQASGTEQSTQKVANKKSIDNSNPRLDDIPRLPAISNPRLDDHLHKLTPPTKPENDSGLDSSDEDFALALESEFNKNEDHSAVEQDLDDGNISEES